MYVLIFNFFLVKKLTKKIIINLPNWEISESRRIMAKSRLKMTKLGHKLAKLELKVAQDEAKNG